MTDFLLRAAGVRRRRPPGVVAPAWLLVLGGRIAYLGPIPPDAVPEGLPEVQVDWLVEPFADAHVHLFLPGDFDRGARRRVTALADEAALERVLGVLRACRALGIAAVRDGGGPRGLALRAARIANARPDRYAAVLPAGEPVFRRGRYGSFLGSGVEDLADAAALLGRNRAAGATHAKVIATGLNGLDRPGVEGPPQFDAGELRALVGTATRLGLPTMVHANGSASAVLDAGPRTLEHGFGVSAADRRRLGEGATAWTPTLHAWAVLGDHPDLTAAQRRVVGITHRGHAREVREGHAAGARILAGSDAGTPGVGHGKGLWAEFRRLREAGLSAPEVLEAGWASRELCEEELGRPLGTLVPGEPAGFSWVSGDPGEDLARLVAPRGVYLGGRWSWPGDGVRMSPEGAEMRPSGEGV